MYELLWALVSHLCSPYQRHSLCEACMIRAYCSASSLFSSVLHVWLQWLCVGLLSAAKTQVTYTKYCSWTGDWSRKCASFILNQRKQLQDRHTSRYTPNIDSKFSWNSVCVLQMCHPEVVSLHSVPGISGEEGRSHRHPAQLLLWSRWDAQRRHLHLVTSCVSCRLDSFLISKRRKCIWDGLKIGLHSRQMLKRCERIHRSNSTSNPNLSPICAVNHEWLLSDAVDILPFLLLPLAGPEELTEEENDGECGSYSIGNTILVKSVYHVWQEESGDIQYDNKSHEKTQTNNELILLTSLVCVQW